MKMLGQKMKQLRLDRNVSQKELAASAGVALSSVAGLERGCSVSLLTLIPILRALGALEMLMPFLREPEISPIAYAKMLDGVKKRQRASGQKQSTSNIESEW
jgi:transcriptional regulator with XRE-family HTH domain